MSSEILYPDHGCDVLVSLLPPPSYAGLPPRHRRLIIFSVSVLLQALWLKPVLALPRHTRAARIIFWTLFSKPSVEEPIKKNSIQKAIEKEKLELSKPPANFQPAPFTGAIISPGEPDVTLETVLLDVDIARCMSTYLHHADLVALTCTTKKLNKSLFQTYQNNGRGIWYEDNIGFMRNNSCNPDSLSECWACGHRICDVSLPVSKSLSLLAQSLTNHKVCSGLQASEGGIDFSTHNLPHQHMLRLLH